MRILVALLPVAAIVVSMSVLNLRAAPSCGVGLVLSVILGISGYALQASSVIPILLRGVLSSWDLVFLTIGGSLMGAVLTANGTTGVLSSVLSSHHKARLLLAGTCLGVIPAVSALIGPGSYFVGIPLLMSLGIGSSSDPRLSFVAVVGPSRFHVRSALHRDVSEYRGSGPSHHQPVFCFRGDSYSSGCRDAPGHRARAQDRSAGSLLGYSPGRDGWGGPWVLPRAGFPYSYRRDGRHRRLASP